MIHGDTSFYEAHDAQYEWYESLKRDLDVIHAWREQFHYKVGGKRNETNHAHTR